MMQKVIQEKVTLLFILYTCFGFVGTGQKDANSTNGNTSGVNGKEKPKEKAEPKSKVET